MDLETLYQQHCRSGTAIAPHLRRLRALAEGLPLAVEFGVKQGASSTALLLGAARVRSYDIVATPQARSLEQLVTSRWRYRIQSSLAAPVSICDLLFIDSLHTFAQCDAELRRHADGVIHLLVFHDTLTFGSVGADDESGRQLWDYSQHRGQSVPETALGIRPAIDRLMMRDARWRIRSHHLDSHGLLVLERR